MKIDLIEVDKNNQRHLRAMFQAYVTEMQQFLDQNDEKGDSVNPAEILNDYLESRPNWPYLISADGEIAGFCLLRHYPGETETMDIDQFYISDDFRRKGVGATSLKKLIEYHPGNWLIRVMKSNTGALEFWLKAVEACVGPGYECKNDKQGMHFIRFTTQSL